jgi:microcin C transport system substrate-binding protein
LVAEWVSFPPDYSSVTFGLRPEARFHDGKPITPDDVVFSLAALKRADPQHGQYYKNVVKAEKTGEHEVTFTFDVKGNRELPAIVGEMAVLPKHYWEGKGSDGQPRDISKTTMEPPLGSGPYRIKSFEAGRRIVYERVKDYWAKDLPVNRGQWNFDEIRYEYYRDRVPAFEAFKSGSIDYWQESSSQSWAQQYDFDAVKKGLIKKEPFAHKRVAGMQSFCVNRRGKQLQDRRVRQAFNLAFDFESANKNLFYGAYTRSNSFFANSELASSGVPQGAELAMLEPLKAEVPPDVFTAEYKNPVNITPEDMRGHLRDAFNLLKGAGWTQKGGALVNAAGEPLTVEILLVQPDFERVSLPYIENLKKLGVQASVRVVDASQYQRRVKSFDFDMIVASFPQSHSPGNEQRFFWSSSSAAQEGSRNVVGIANPAVDKLIDTIVFAKDRAELVTATHALDRVLLWNFYVVPQWYRAADWIARWDIFGHPATPPSQNVSALRTWWYDAAKAKAIAAQRGQ